MSSAPVVVLANWYQCMPGEQVGSQRVESRMLAWCRNGSGQVWVDGSEYPLPPGGFVFLPWYHHIAYRAARHRPFLLGGVHLIPRYSGPFRTGVAQDADHPLANSPGRRDDPALPGHVIAGQFDDHPGLGPLVEYLAQTWFMQRPNAEIAHAQGALVYAAIQRLLATSTATTLPNELRRLQAAVLRNLDRSWNLASLAETAGCSTAWLVRLSRRYWRTSPNRWLNHMRLEQARKLLATSDKTIVAIAETVGIPNRHRFSRSFHAAYGASPRAWRNDHRGP